MKEAVSRLAVSSMIAVLGVVALMTVCDPLDFRPSVVAWLIYVVSAGVVLNTSRGERPLRLLGLAVLPGCVPGIAVVFLLYFAQMAGGPAAPPPCLVSLPLGWPGAVWFLGALSVLSTVSIFLFSFARTPITGLVRLISHDKTPGKIATVEKTVRALLSLAGAVSLLFAAIFG